MSAGSSEGKVASSPTPGSSLGASALNSALRCGHIFEAPFFLHFGCGTDPA